MRLPEEYNDVINLTDINGDQAIMFYFQNLSSSNITVTITDSGTIVGDLERYLYCDPTESTTGYPYAGTPVELGAPITLSPGVIYECLMFVRFKAGADLNKSASYTSGISFKFEQA